jgi:hypothetical protein
MANPTSNFNWQMPTASDLVTDLPADFEVFGQAVDTSLADLKGGTTDQVLAKNSNTDMDFKWVTSDDANAIQNSIVDAKGDLIAASANDTPARLAVGNNGETLVADSSTSTGLRYTAGTVQGNPVINSAMQVWQRGTSISLAASSGATYLADRWLTTTAANQACTVSRQVTGDTTNLPSIQYALRYQRNSGQTGTGNLILINPFETINSIPFAGKAVTLSFYARSGANYSATSSALTVKLDSGTGTDQNPFAGYTGAATVCTSTATLTTTWQRFTATGTVSATATELNIQAIFTPTGTAGANDYYEITGVQIDVGSVALPFRTYAATIQGELSACQYYYQKSYSTGVNPATATELGRFHSSSGTNNSNWNAYSPKLNSTMRVAPTITIYDMAGNAGKLTTLAQNSAETNNVTATPSYIGTGSFGLFLQLSSMAGIGVQWVASAEL